MSKVREERNRWTIEAKDAGLIKLIQLPVQRSKVDRFLIKKMNQINVLDQILTARRKEENIKKKKEKKNK